MGCPDTNTIVAFAEGLLADSEQLELEEHVDRCSACRRLVSAAIAPVSVTLPAEGEQSRAGALGEQPLPLDIGRYRLERPLGRGGMGSVWVARHTELGMLAAVKLMDGNIAKSAEALSRFRREARAAASLRGSNVVQILDYGVEQGRPFIVMELLEGSSLRERLTRETALAPDVVAYILSEAGKAVTRAHEEGIVHRDLKPDNIFLAREGEDEIVKVLDFGIAKTGEALGTTEGSATRTGEMLGTPHYMSPEQASGRQSVDHRSDIWSLAVVACECLTGQRPFDEQTIGGLVLAICSEEIPVPSQLGPVPPHFDGWFQRSTRRDPDQRFQSVREQMAELREICHVGVVAPSPAAGDPTPRRAGTGRRSPWLLALAIPALVLLGALGLGASTAVSPAKSKPAAAVASASSLTQPTPQTVSRPQPIPASVAELEPPGVDASAKEPSPTEPDISHGASPLPREAPRSTAPRRSPQPLPDATSPRGASPTPSMDPPDPPSSAPLRSARERLAF